MCVAEDFINELLKNVYKLSIGLLNHHQLVSGVMYVLVKGVCVCVSGLWMP